jgi:hypothetical protein
LRVAGQWLRRINADRLFLMTPSGFAAQALLRHLPLGAAREGEGGRLQVAGQLLRRINRFVWSTLT